MALKGHTKIELTNVNTGEVEIYEDDNMVTNALENYFQSLGTFGEYTNLVSSQSLSNFLRRFTNGLFLFDKTLEERPDNLLPPGGTQMTGRGSILVYDSLDKTMGSYSSESKSLYNGYGYEHIWEFNTTQANGKINCACLTTALGGKIGTGTAYVDTSLSSLDSNFESIFTNNSSYSRINNKHMLVRIDPDKNYCLYIPDFNNSYSDMNHRYFIHTNCSDGRFAGRFNYDSQNYINQTDLNNSILNTHNLTLYKYRVPFNNLSLFEYQKSPELIETITIHLSELNTIITEEMKTLSRSSIFYYNYNIITKNDYMYFYFDYINKSSSGATYAEEYNNIENSTHGYVWKINLITFEIEKFFEIKNIVSNNKNGIGLLHGAYYTYDYNYSTYKPQKRFHITDNEYLINVATFNDNGQTIIGLCKIDLNNQTDFEWIHWCEGPEDKPHTWNGIYYMNMFDYQNKMYVVNSANYYVDCIDTIDNSNYFITSQASSIYGGNYAFTNLFLFHYNNYLFLIYQYDNYLKYTFLPNMLVTINNLPQEIIKSPEQTMKVTYTIVDDNYVTD